MKKIIVLMAIAGLLISGLALAGSINAYGDRGTQIIHQADDSGNVRTYNSYNLGAGSILCLTIRGIRQW